MQRMRIILSQILCLILMTGFCYAKTPIKNLSQINPVTASLATLATNMYVNEHFKRHMPKSMGLECMIKNIYMEARGENKMGKLLVASTVMNRRKLSRYPSTICGVIYQPHQFSWTRSKSLNRHYQLIKGKRDAEYLQSVWAALYSVVFKGNVGVGVTSYYAPKQMKMLPSWSQSKEFKLAGDYGGHRFFQLVE
jgi:spore germination cell wall hydrolase CwlJ-like protein